MSFIDDSEFVLLMDVPTITGKTATLDDLKALRDAGIRTTVMFINNRDDVEKERGVYDWRAYDEYVEQAQAADMKVMLMCYTSGPAADWVPESWFIKTKTGPVRGCLSMWNPEARELVLDYYRAMVQRYSTDKTMVINSWLTHGETILLNEAAWYDDCAIASFQAHSGLTTQLPCPNTEPTEKWLRESYISFMMDQQRILVEQPTHEVWMEQHPMIAHFGGMYGNGCNIIPELMAAYSTLPGVTKISWILYTYVQWAFLYPYINSLKDVYKIDLYGGAEYAEGILVSTDIARSNNIRGMFCGPLHPFAQHAHVEPWMVDNIKAAHVKWGYHG